MTISRRAFGALAFTAASHGLAARVIGRIEPQEFRLKYMLGSCLYGYQYIGEILPEVRKTGASAIDIWPKVHGNQREQLDDLGEEKFAQMLRKHQVTIAADLIGAAAALDELHLDSVVPVT